MEARRNDYPFLALKSRPFWRELDRQRRVKIHIWHFSTQGYMIRQLGVELR
jgi:hypothetical protein